MHKFKLLGSKDPEVLSSFFDTAIRDELMNRKRFRGMLGDLEMNVPYVVDQLSKSVLTGYPAGFWALGNLSVIANSYLKNLETIESAAVLESSANQVLIMLGYIRLGSINPDFYIEIENQRGHIAPFINIGRTFFMTSACNKRRAPEEKDRLAYMAHTFTAWTDLLSLARNHTFQERAVIRVS